ncbi:hypothetical protein GBZ48_22045 [Azospirillum melinis]|uniref:HTH luxR-type domain-containing protein n=2 Tax=Azospirillum melinis TaxID=328839 RepID=A0ABX2KEB6_9PROT|nr:hypothetical protein [Azospirillum melinis]MBP2307490.1 DNA-binding CsgD family transcriptional regulator [Azospirillum melinis]NUB01935.1 hypothetical protein [Azospirillum melinis]
MLAIPSDIPTPFSDLAVMAARLRAPLVVFDEKDQCRYTSEWMRRVYEFCDFSRPADFEAILRRAWEYGGNREVGAPPDLETSLAMARASRQRIRLEFVRTQPRRLICNHVRIGSGWSAQLRVEPERAGLEHYFTADMPVTGIVEAIRRHEQAKRCARALDSVSLAVVVVGPDAGVLHSNDAAKSLCQRNDGFLVDDNGRLRAIDPTVDPFFARTVAMAAMGEIPGGRSLLHIAGCQPGAPHAVSITAGADQPGVAAIVAISSAKLDDVAVTRLLRDQFGLTSAEATLAVEIGGGKTNDQVSKILGKSPATGREQLHNIFKKLARQNIAVKGQIELSRWVSVLASITGAARKSGNQ